ncbi:MAG: 6-pyruvoyl trahydropterin synthase family protein [Promethearchaeota archaeon]
MFTLEKDVLISAAHFLPGYKGKCREVHGHNYFVRVSITSRTIDEGTGMLIDYNTIKAIVDKYDHGSLNDFIENPTAEKFARRLAFEFIWEVIHPGREFRVEELADPGVREELARAMVEVRLTVAVEVRETPNSRVTYRFGWGDCEEVDGKFELVENVEGV